MLVDLIVAHAAQLVTLSGDEGPRRGAAMSELGLISDGAVAVHEGHIVDVGTSADILSRYQSDRVLDATDKVVLPGFVDPHTHLVWAGDRAEEFELRVGGASYMEIMAAGGGILSTVRATRSASVETLISQSRARLDHMLANGTTTAEVKTGYGLELATELKQIEAIRRLQSEHPIDLVPTFLGAHAVPEKYAGRTDEYTNLVVEEMLPQVKDTFDALYPGNATLFESGPFCDVFCEKGAFDLEQSRRVLAAAKARGLGLKIHVDEFAALGGTRLAVDLGAVTADHLVCTPPEELALLAQSDTIAVSLPGTPFGLGHCEYSPARQIIDSGGALALATDLNPGTCWCESMQFPIALACRYMQMTPAEAICAATINAAHAIDLGGKTGSIEPGKWADLSLLDAPDYRHLGYRFGVNLVGTVVKKGTICPAA